MEVPIQLSRFWRAETFYFALAALPPLLLSFLAGPTVLFWTAVSFENMERLSQYAQDVDSNFRFEAAEELTLIWRTTESPAPELDLVVANLRDSAEDPRVRARFRERIDDVSRDYAEKRSAILLQSVIPILRSDELDPARALVQSDKYTAALGPELTHTRVGQSKRDGFSEPEVVDLVLEFWWDKHDTPVLDV